MSRTDTMSDAWTASSSAVHDLASTAAERAAEMASAAAEQFEDLPDRVAGLATAARGRIRPAPRRARRPWLVLAIGVAAVVAVAWWWRRRPTSSPAVDMGPDGRPNPVRDAASSATGG